MNNSRKAAAKKIFKGNAATVSLFWTTCLLLVFCLGFLPEIFSSFFLELRWGRAVYPILSFGIFLLVFLIFSGLRLGSDRFFLRRAQKKGGSAADLFYYFLPGKIFSAAVFCIKMCFLRLFWAIVCFLPAALCSFPFFQSGSKGLSFRVSLVFAATLVLFLLNGIVFYKSISFSFFLARYYFIEGKFVSFSHVLASSQQEMKKRKKELLKLKLSFVGFLPAVLLIFPAFYVSGLYRQSLAVAAKDFMK